MNTIIRYLILTVLLIGLMGALWPMLKSLVGVIIFLLIAATLIKLNQTIKAQRPRKQNPTLPYE